MIERRGYCNRCGLCELGGPPTDLIVWDPAKQPGEEDACYHRLIRDFLEGRPPAEILADWLAQEPSFDRNVEKYLSFPRTPDAVIEGCNYRFYQDGRELPPKLLVDNHWEYPDWDAAQPIRLNPRLYGELTHGN